MQSQMAPLPELRLAYGEGNQRRQTFGQLARCHRDQYDYFRPLSFFFVIFALHENESDMTLKFCAL